MDFETKQFFQAFAQLLRCHAELTTGAYKLAKTEQACGKNENGTFAWRPLTEEEKLKNKMSEMRSHVHRLYDFGS